MSILTRIQNFPSVARFISHLRDPLYLNGYALVFSSAATSGLGVLYWIVAARTYSTEVVGLNSAVISVMTFLAYISQLNLMNVLNRFIPNVNRVTAGRMIVYSYLVSLILAIVSSLIFILGINIFEPELDFLGSSPFYVLWFTGATMTWCIFVMQDSALTGLRQAIWVPLENLFFAVMKIGLLVVLVAITPRYGVLASWTIAVAVTILPTNLLIFWRLLPRHSGGTGDKTELITLPKIVNYVASDYLGSMVLMAAMNVLPIVIIDRLGAAANAYFSLSWMIAYALYLISRNMGMSFIAEVSSDQSKLNLVSYRLFINMARMTVPLVAAIVLGAPYILRLFGNNYASEGATLLRLLCLSALPNMVVSLYTSVVRVQRRTKALFLILTLPYLLVMAFSFLLMGTYGIIGVGIAWLAGQSLAAGFLLVTELRVMWTKNNNLEEETSKLLVEPIVSLISNLLSSWRAKQLVSHISPWIHQIVQPVARLTEIAPGDDWRIKEAYPSLGEMGILTIGPLNSSYTAMLHLPKSHSAVMGFENNLKTCAGLQEDMRLSEEWRRLLPNLLYEGVFEERPYWIVERLPGISATRMFLDADKRQIALETVFEAVGYLHQRTAKEVIVDDKLLESWISDPLQVIHKSNMVYYHRQSHVLLDRLERQLFEALRGQHLVVSRTHGDYWPSNILVTPEGSRVTGIVDWELSEPAGLPGLDLVNLLLSVRQIEEGMELGKITAEVLTQGAWRKHEQALWEQAKEMLGGKFPEMREAVLVFWLQHLSAVLQKSRRYSINPIFAYGNYVQVLNCL